MGLLWHLALRRYPSAMTELSRRIGEDGLSAADPFSAAGLNYRAYRRGDPLAAYEVIRLPLTMRRCPASIGATFGDTGIGSVVQPARAMLMPSNNYAILKRGFRTALLAKLVGGGRVRTTTEARLHSDPTGVREASLANRV